MPLWTKDRVIILILLCAVGGWPFLLYFIPKWNREDLEEEEED